MISHRLGIYKVIGILMLLVVILSLVNLGVALSTHNWQALGILVYGWGLGGYCVYLASKAK